MPTASKTLSTRTKVPHKAESSKMPVLTDRQLRKIHFDFLNDPDVFAYLEKEFTRKYFMAASGACALYMMCLAYAPQELLDRIEGLIDEGASYAHAKNSR